MTKSQQNTVKNQHKKIMIGTKNDNDVAMLRTHECIRTVFLPKPLVGD